ncbi:MAG: type I-G CRISPR-associated helicase/endonuclease Cas3g [Acidimicrobiales bacterium]
MFNNVDELMERASDQRPYPYQRRLAEQGLPDLLAVETGAGKTAAVFFAWLWRRRFHPDASIRAATPRWLVICEPMRTLTTQTEQKVREWLSKLQAELLQQPGREVLVHVVMGGRREGQRAWRLHPEQDAVVIGTVDMLVSRVLNRGFGASRFSWPIDFGMLNSGTHWVFDEVQLLGPALPTTRQLQSFRDTLGTALGTSSTWMSATVDRDAMSTVDSPYPADGTTEVRLSDKDRADKKLKRRLDAIRTIQRISLEGKPKGKRPAMIAEAALNLHQPGTLTLIVVNRVKTAQDVYAALGKLPAPEGEPMPECFLLHGRFRPADRERTATEALDQEAIAGGPGRIVVSTQVVEAGLDISARALLTEAAPWPSIVQRAGRCNRDGSAKDAVLAWVPVDAKDAAPYKPQDVAEAVAALEALEGAEVTSTMLGERDVEVLKPGQPVLRRTDLLSLFDTAPDVSGNDVDVSPYIRDDDGRDVFVAWHALDGKGTPPPATVRPSAEELCKVPLNKEVRDFFKVHDAWRFDPLGGARDGRRGRRREWVRVHPNDRLRPGETLVVPCTAGGYDPLLGWTPASTAPVLKVVVDDELEQQGPVLEGGEDALNDDPLSRATDWVSLRDHLEEAESAVRDMTQALAPTGLSAEQLEAVAVAGRLHDLGKAHQVFQGSMLAVADESEREMRRAGAPWAKSGTDRRLRHERPSFRHELASALALLGDARVLLRGVAEPDLVVYLVAAHHGRVRLGIRSVPEADGERYVLGVGEGDELPRTEVPGGESPPLSLSLDPVRMGSAADGGPSWSERALRLLDDLGPFRLGFLEALVRLADWRASEPHGLPGLLVEDEGEGTDVERAGGEEGDDEGEEEEDDEDAELAEVTG